MFKPRYIYILADGYRPRYAGQSVNPHVRYKQHMKDDTSSAKAKWIRSMKRKAKTPRLFIVGVCFTKTATNRAENWWVDTLNKFGCDLVNGTLTINDSKINPLSILYITLSFVVSKIIRSK